MTPEQYVELAQAARARAALARGPPAEIMLSIAAMWEALAIHARSALRLTHPE